MAKKPKKKKEVAKKISFTCGNCHRVVTNTELKCPFCEKEND